MGSLCCVAARPRGSSAGSREWSLEGNEPYWQNNSSFSPAVSRRWDLRIQPEGLSYGSHGDSQLGCYGSSLSSNSKGSRSWLRGEHLHGHHSSVSDDVVSYFSSPSESYGDQQLTPPPVQGVYLNGYAREPASGPWTFSQSVEGGSTSSRSDGSVYEFASRAHTHSIRNLSGRCSFLTKPIHPLVFTEDSPEGEVHGSVGTTSFNNSLHPYVKSIRELTGLQSSVLMDLGDTSQRETAQWSSGSSFDLTDISETLEAQFSGIPNSNPSEGSRCGLCERLLSQRSPWGSRRIIRSGDMPIAGVLSCWHVYHAECLEHATPKTQKHDPPCPLCEKYEGNVPEQWALCRLRNGLPRLRSVSGEGSSRLWSCGQLGDCVEGAIHGPKKSSVLLLNHNMLKRSLSLKGNLNKDRVEKPKASGLASSQLFDVQRLGDQGAVGCSRIVSSPAPI